MHKGLWVLLPKYTSEIVNHLGTFGIVYSTKYDLGHTNLPQILVQSVYEMRLSQC